MKSAQSRPRNPQSRHRIEPGSTRIALAEVAPRRSPAPGHWQSGGGDTGTRSRAHLQPLANESRRRPWRSSPATFPQFCAPRGRSREGRSSRAPGPGAARRGRTLPFRREGLALAAGQVRAPGESGVAWQGCQPRPCGSAGTPPVSALGCWGGAVGWRLGRPTSANSVPFSRLAGHHQPWL